MAEVVAVCISTVKGVPKKEVTEIEVRKDHGIVDDAHAGNWHRQISLLGDESVEKMRKTLPGLKHGAFAENIVTKGLTLYELPVGTKLRVGPTLLQVTQIGKQCHNDCAIKKATGECVMPREGIFAIVLEEGRIRAGDRIEIVE